MIAVRFVTSILYSRCSLLPKPFLILCLLSLVASERSGAQSVALQDTAVKGQGNRFGTWSARSSGGRTLMGTWTAVPDSASGTVIGTWTLADERGNTLAYGGWSAAKERAEWTGAWRAVISGRDGEFTGTWSAAVDLKVNAQFDDLFEKAAQTIVSGDWRAGRRTGAWSIRAAPR